MKDLDRLLQRWRIAKVSPFIPSGGRILDIGCGDGALFKRLHGRIGEGVGVDPTLTAPVQAERYRLLPGYFPAALPDGRAFDAITLLAVLEHIPICEQPAFAAECARLLEPGGVMLITVPSPAVDRILGVLKALRLIDGMSLEEHYGFDPRQTSAVFSVPGLILAKSATFQLGLNHLFVFKKTGMTRSPDVRSDRG